MRLSTSRQEAATGSPSRWESLCTRCGQCCHVRRLTPSGLYVDTTAPCRFLDRSTRLCTVYPDRFRLCADCKKLTLAHALFSPYLPDTCGYVQKYRVSRILDRVLSRVVKGLLGTEGIEARALRR
jgi:uncharacterized cysteine cluster protein YcgN (CxxCxxCC family)